MNQRFWQAFLGRGIGAVEIYLYLSQGVQRANNG